MSIMRKFDRLMGKRLLLAFLLFSAMVQCAETRVSASPSIDTLRQSVILILGAQRAGGSRTCPLLPAGYEPKTSATAFFVSSKGHAVTNHHVVDHAKQEGLRLFAVLNSGDQPVWKSVKVVDSDPDIDVAILQIQGVRADESTPLKLEGSPGVRALDPVWICGFPGGTNVAANDINGPEPALTRGEIAAVRKDNAGSIKQIDVTAGASYGSSGSPIVNGDGKVVAVLWGTKDPLGRFVSGTFAERVKEFLQNNVPGLQQPSFLPPPATEEEATGEINNGTHPPGGRTDPLQSATATSPPAFASVTGGGGSFDMTYENSSGASFPIVLSVLFAVAACGVCAAAVVRYRSNRSGFDSRPNGHLTIRIPSHQYQSPPLKLVTRIGRASDNEIVLEDDRVSAHHAVIYWDRRLQRYVLRDLGSTNGTYVDIVRTASACLLPRNEITMGQTMLQLRVT